MMKLRQALFGIAVSAAMVAGIAGADAQALPNPTFKSVTSSSLTANQATVGGYDVATAAGQAARATPLWNMPAGSSTPSVYVSRPYVAIDGGLGSWAGAGEFYYGSPNLTGANGAVVGGGSGGAGRVISITCAPKGTLNSSGVPYDPTTCSMTALAAEAWLPGFASGNTSAWAANFTVKADPGSSGGIFGIETDFINNSGHAGGFGEWVGSDGNTPGLNAFYADGWPSGGWLVGFGCHATLNACLQSSDSSRAVIGDNGTHLWGAYWGGTYSKYVWQYTHDSSGATSIASLDPSGNFYTTGGLTTTSTVSAATSIALGTASAPISKMTAQYGLLCQNTANACVQAADSSPAIVGDSGSHMWGLYLGGTYSKYVWQYTHDASGATSIASLDPSGNFYTTGGITTTSVTIGTASAPVSKMTSQYGLLCQNLSSACVQAADNSPAIVGDSGNHMWGLYLGGTYSKYVWQYTHDTSGATSIASLDAGGNIFSVGGFTTTAGVKAATVTLVPAPVARLPSPCTIGALAYASDGRKPGEAAGAGSGVPVVCTPLSNGASGAWVAVSLASAAVAN